MAKGKKYTKDEDDFIREWAGKRTAAQIGAHIGRTSIAIVNRFRILKISGKMVGEDHYNSKLSNLQVEMLHALVECGFTGSEIHKAVFKHVTKHHIYDIINSKARLTR